MKIKIPGKQRLNGSLAAPGSKAYTHRALIASLLSKGECRILRRSYCDDVQRTLTAIEELGAKVSIEEGDLVSRSGGGIASGSGKHVYCGDSGTTLRLLTAIASTSSGTTVLKMSTGLARRPHSPLLQSLKELGASADMAENGSEIIVKGPLKGGETWIDGRVSSQFISGLLFASPLARTDVTIHVTGVLQSRPYVEMTIDALEKHCIRVDHSENDFYVQSNQVYLPTTHKVPGDFSSASFMMAGAGIPGSEITITGVNDSRFEPDSVIIKLLDEMGADMTREGSNLTVKGTGLHSFSFDAKDNPDIVPPLQVLATFAEGESEISGVDRLRYKETNRLETVPSELAKMGSKIVLDDGRLRIRGTKDLHGALLDSRGDHRVAMACSIAALAAEGDSDVNHAEVVSKSYPDFFKDLSTLGVKLDVE